MARHHWLAAAAILAIGSLAAQSRLAVTTPKQALGFNLGDDYQVANYTQLETYWKKLAAESDRMKLVDIGTTAEGRRQYMAIVSSPENIRNLDRYKGIARRLALAEGLTEDQARALARDGKAVVWIDGGLHASETVGSQQLMEMVYQMVSRDDPETMRLLNDTIQLYVQANPDGQELVANWYMRDSESRQAQPERTAEAVSQVRQPRRQSRFLPVGYAGDDQHEPAVVHQVVPASRLQPSPDRVKRSGRIHSALSRSVHGSTWIL
jgi:hypothetical protein